jgi:hypothetical protein
MTASASSLLITPPMIKQNAIRVKAFIEN